ncbi:hypothetical protein BSM4216_0927 [Bacillus smithii]|nr:hypothetical protein BSM4216_0927 [Bacillus smithii]
MLRSKLYYLKKLLNGKRLRFPIEKSVRTLDIIKNKRGV